MLPCCCRKVSALPIFARHCRFKPQPISALCTEAREFANYGIQSLSDLRSPYISSFAIKGFSEITTLIIGRTLHGLCIKGLFNLSAFHTNTLINMYSKYGNIDHARYVFDGMSERNEASWNSMTSGYVRVGLYCEAIQFFRVMQWQGFSPNGFVIASLVTACDRSGCLLNEGVQVHCIAVKVGLLCDVFVGTSLLHFYGAYGFVSSARNHFEQMSNRNVVSWTSLMVGYSNSGDPGEVLKLYKCMMHEGVCCNQNTFATVISSCGFLEDALLGNQILAQVIKSGFGYDVSVANSLVSMLGSLGNVEEAHYVFDHMDERDTISWNSIISANARNGLCEGSLRFFYWMRHVHNEINSTTLSALLSVCSIVDNLKWGKGIHSLVVKLGLESNVCICNTLLTMYSEAGRSEDAESVFKGMHQKDLISWNSMIACYAQDGKCLDALEILGEMLCVVKIWNYVTLTSALAACSNPEYIIEGRVVHALLILAGLQDNLITGNALVTMYGKFGKMAEAKQVSQTMPKRDEVTWNALIGGYAENEEPGEAIKAFKLMREERMPANYITIVNLLGAFLTFDDLVKQGMPVHAHIVKMGFECDNYVKNTLLTMYAKCGDFDSSNHIFDNLTNKNNVIWNAMVSANAHHGRGEEALKLFDNMRSAGVNLDQFSFSGGLAAASNLAVLEEGQQIHSLVIKLGFESDLHVTNAAMDMYGKCGEIDDVLKILSHPIERSRMSWNILISAYSRQGCFQKARETFHDMVKVGLKPDHVTFVSLLSACSHGGLVDEGLAYYASMSANFGVTPAIEHCVCIIDLLGRSGRLTEAETFIKEMPVPPNGLVWRSLLAACKVHGNLTLGRKAAEHLLNLDSSDDSAYVLYSNVCATSGRWEDVENLRMQMGSNKIKKQPACSWVKLKNKVSSFGMGDQSHPQAGKIYAKLGELMKMIKEAGYVPDTSYALHDTDEEQKEQNLWNHSERLALAYALINTPEGSTIKVFKNLRVCGDCHSVFKFVSGIVKRKIIMKDPYRFHHFHDGKCSCSDYW